VFQRGVSYLPLSVCRDYVYPFEADTANLGSCPHQLEHDASPKEELCGFVLEISSRPLCDKLSRHNLTTSTQGLGCRCTASQAEGLVEKAVLPACSYHPFRSALLSCA